jgi:hypothetical protein
MSNRYTRRSIIVNDSETYNEQREARRVSLIRHFSSPDMAYPNSKQLTKITMIGHIWKHGDRYYKLAHKHYGDKKLWWLIAWFNKAPTESHLSTGQAIQIPVPLAAALSYIRER